MMQGDCYNLGIRIRNNAGNPVTPEDVKDVQITIGPYTKRYAKAELFFEDGLWFFPLTQAESFSMVPNMAVPAAVRLVWVNGVVEGKPLYGVRFEESISKEVL